MITPTAITPQYILSAYNFEKNNGDYLALWHYNICLLFFFVLKFYCSLEGINIQYNMCGI